MPDLERALAEGIRPKASHAGNIGLKHVPRLGSIAQSPNGFGSDAIARRPLGDKLILVGFARFA